MTPRLARSVTAAAAVLLLVAAVSVCWRFNQDLQRAWGRGPLATIGQQVPSLPIYCAFVSATVL